MLSPIHRAEMLATLTEDENNALDVIVQLLKLGTLEDDSINSLPEIFGQFLDALTPEQRSCIHPHNVIDTFRNIGISQRH